MLGLVYGGSIRGLMGVSRGRPAARWASCGWLNVAGYFDSFTALVERAVIEGFVEPEHRELLLTRAEPALLLDSLLSQSVPMEVPRPIARRQAPIPR